MNQHLFLRQTMIVVSLLLTLFTRADNSQDSRDKILSEQFRRYYSEMMVDSALNTLDELIALRHEQGDAEREGMARWNRIATLNNAARYDSLLVEADKQMEWFKEHQIWNRFYQCWQRRCSANHDLGRMQTALREARAMADDAQMRNNNTGRAMAYKQMGIIYYDIRQMKPACEAFEHSVRLLKEEGDDSGILSGVYDGLCQSYDRSKLYEKELETSDEWLEHLAIVLKLRGIDTVAPVYVSAWLAHSAAYIGLNDLDKAEEALGKAEEYQAQSASALATYYINEMHTRLALARNQVTEAIAYTDSTLKSGIRVDEKIRELRAEAMLKAGRSAEAAELYQSLYEEKDSVFTRDMRSQLDELNTLFHVDELQKEKQQSQMRFTILTATLIVLALVIILILRSRGARRLAVKNHELAEKNAALEEANLRVEESTKMKLDFVRNMSHEIRTPLNILNGFTQILMIQGNEMDDNEKDTMRRQVEENTNRITELVNKMLELSEANSHAPIERTAGVAASQIVGQAIQNVNQYGHTDVEFTKDTLQIEGVTLTTNESYATRTLNLLLDNAYKFTKKGQVRLKVERQAEQQRIAFIVEDTGIGIPEAEADHIFEEFVQLDTFADGTGIGLTVARNLARRLGGDVQLDPTYSGGARFIFTLPLLTEGQAPCEVMPL